MVIYDILVFILNIMYFCQCLVWIIVFCIQTLMYAAMKYCVLLPLFTLNHSILDSNFDVCSYEAYKHV